MKRALLALGVTFGVALVALFAFLIYVLLASGDASYWEGEIADFERRDVSNPPPENAVLFVGGRDVRLWTTLAEDMAPVPVIGRGFGGAQIPHINHYRARIIHPYKPRAIIIMAGDADLADVRGRPPDDLLEHFRTLLLSPRADGEGAALIFVSTRTSPS